MSSLLGPSYSTMVESSHKTSKTHASTSHFPSSPGIDLCVFLCLVLLFSLNKTDSVLLGNKREMVASSLVSAIALLSGLALGTAAKFPRQSTHTLETCQLNTAKTLQSLNRLWIPGCLLTRAGFRSQSPQSLLRSMV